VDSTITSLVTRECGPVRGSGQNVGHLALGGIEGTGKTTFMRAFAIGAAVLLNHMIPITHAYTVATNTLSVSTMVRAAAVGLFGAKVVESEPLNDPLLALTQLRSACGDPKSNVFLLLDEIQHLFALEPADTLAARINAVF
jgi:MoxR-like ATPase